LNWGAVRERAPRSPAARTLMLRWGSPPRVHHYWPPTLPTTRARLWCWRTTEACAAGRLPRRR
jgi:hypothetical protein